MKGIMLLTAFVAVFAAARDNPFKIAQNAQKESYVGASMEEINKADKLQTIGLQLPLEIVKIKKITIEYQSVDGQKAKKVYEIEKSVEPLKPLKIYQ
ncbi:MAG TPA: hypothetical protein PLV58_08905 [Campylobacterales bacterium]|nr:hypothetical protein [Campylobacterales bacterium]